MAKQPLKKRSHKKNSSQRTPSTDRLTHQVRHSWHRRVIKPVRNFLIRRPHRSFQRTRRRDYVRSLRLPGYWAFTAIVWRQLWKERKLFGLFIVLYVILSVILIGFGSQENYNQLAEVLKQSGSTLFSGGWGEIGKAGLLLAAGASGSFIPQLSEAQQIYSAIVVLLVWLTTVWLLRSIFAGSQPRLRDAIYNAGAPIVSTGLVALILVLQLIPVAFAVIGYSAAMATDFLSTGAIAMTFWVAAFLLTVLSVYWITSTIIALVVVTLPGMYPLQAIRTAGDMVVGRRIRILLRLIWVVVSTIVFWIIVVIPVILLDGWIKSILPVITWLPIVPFVILIVTSASTVWVSSYVYMLYRRVVEDDASPA